MNPENKTEVYVAWALNMNCAFGIRCSLSTFKRAIRIWIHADRDIHACNCPTLHGKFPEETFGQRNIFGSQQVHASFLASSLVQNVPCPGPFDEVWWRPSSVTQLASVSLLSKNHPPTQTTPVRNTPYICIAALRSIFPYTNTVTLSATPSAAASKHSNEANQRVRLRARSVRAPACQRWVQLPKSNIANLTSSYASAIMKLAALLAK